MKTRYDCVLPSPDGARLLLVRENEGWALPHVECWRGWLAETVEEIAAEFLARYGAAVAVLRILQWIPERVTCELELLSDPGAIVPIASAWTGVRDPIADSIPVIGPWREDRGFEHRIEPWQRRGWLREAASWIEARVSPAKLTQVKAGWNGSCVLRVDSPAETLYFKASPRRTPGEPAVIRVLAERWAAHLPSIVDADEDRCWMLMRAIDGHSVNAQNEADLADVARLVARIQIDQAPHADRWLHMGCPDRGLDVLESQLDRILADIPSRLHHAGILTEPERAEIAAFAPRAASLCHALQSFSIPTLTLHHEDFRDGNAQRLADGTLVLIDWNDTVASHPFFTLQRFLWFMPSPPGTPRHEITARSDDAPRRTLRDAYLAEFAAFESAPRLEEAFALSSRLAPLYDILRFLWGIDVDATFRRGLDPTERNNARLVMEHVLAVARTERGSSPPSF